MFDKIKTVGFIGTLIFCTVSAEPVRMVDEHAVEIPGNAGLLEDNANLPTDNGGGAVYYLSTVVSKNPTTNRGTVTHTMRPIDAKTPANANLYFLVEATANDRTYVAVDYLENAAVRERCGQCHGPFPSDIRERIKTLQLCVQLHIEDWGEDIAQYRRDSSLTNRSEIIRKAFQRLKLQSAENGHALIDAVKVVADNLKDNQEIVDRYTVLKICFGNQRAKGDAKKTIDYLLIRGEDSIKTGEERKVIQTVRKYFVHHIAKHFCHHSLMNRPREEFEEANIDPPDANCPYTSLSYEGFNSFADALNLARHVYPQVVMRLSKIYTFEFDIDIPDVRFTVRLQKGRSTPAIVDVGQLVGMGKFAINDLKRIFSYQDVLPEIYNIPRGEAEANVLKNPKFYLFFNLGVKMDDNQQVRNSSVDGSLFPVAS